jgi:hypothetical protein
MAASLNGLNPFLGPNKSTEKNFITKFINIKKDDIDFEQKSITNKKDISSSISINNKKIINIDDFFVNNESSIALANNRTGTDHSNIINKFLVTDRSESNERDQNQKFSKKSPIKDCSIIKKVKNYSTTLSNTRSGSTKNIHKSTISSSGSMPRKLNLKDIKDEIKRDSNNNSAYFARPLISHLTQEKISNSGNHYQQFHNYNHRSDPIDDLRRDFFNQLIASKKRYERNNQKVEDLVSETGVEQNSKIFSVEDLIPAQSFQMAIHPTKEDIKLNFLKQKLPILLEDLNKYGLNELIKNNQEFVKNKYRNFLENNMD